MTLPAIDANTCVVRDTASKRGRHISVKPGTTAARHLHYGRIVLDSESLSFSTVNRFHFRPKIVKRRSSASRARPRSMDKH